MTFLYMRKLAPMENPEKSSESSFPMTWVGVPGQTGLLSTA